MNTTASIALKLIPDKLQSQSVFLCIGDTMVSKFGKTFENVSALFSMPHIMALIISINTVL